MLLFICLEERIGGGWDDSGKESWVLLWIIGGGSWFADTDVRCSDISCFAETYIRWSDIEDVFLVNCWKMKVFLKVNVMINW